MKHISCALLFIISGLVNAQEKKSVEAFNINTPIQIDGILDEQVYSQAMPAKDFVQLMPYGGRPAKRPSEVYFLYDQSAIYVGAMLYDNTDSIYNFFSERDNIGPSDYFGVYFDPYNQGQLAYGFFITPAGVQTDIKAIKTTGDNEDSSWDAVWESRTRITENGWIAEFRIPYSALRFPEKGDGIWGMNMFRNLRRFNSNTSWSFIDRQISGFIHQEGQLTGIKDIRSPLRLSVSPYAAAYTEFRSGKAEFTYKGGMDLKYGISESFTLDMMLVPDFGQIQSDDKQLNLTPYELYYSEKRQFFTEGTELFDRGNVFYSRRIGSAPKFPLRANDALSDNEIIEYDPTETQLLNATKISGRTTKGWGVGVLNAMTLPSYATLKDTVTGGKRNILIQPFTNYNVSVIDKSLANNSYISLLNTSVLMAGDPFMANVTATDFQIRNKKKTYALSGQGGISTRNNGDNETGFFTGISLSKNSGKLRGGISQNIISDNYNPNDLGYLRRNNELNTQAWIGVSIVEPFGIIKDLSTDISFEHNRVYNPGAQYGNILRFNYHNCFMNNYGIFLNFRYNGIQHNYYEPRVPGRFFIDPESYFFGFSMFSDNTKPLSVSLDLFRSFQPRIDQVMNTSFINLNYRLGRRLQFGYSAELTKEVNDRGFADKTADQDTIWFARRDVKTFVNVFGAAYALNNKANINLRMRHYWSAACNNEYYILWEDGTLAGDPDYSLNKDENYNAFNIDLVFRWIFAPGSELSLAWKNSIYASGNYVHGNYWENLDETLRSDQINSFSVKVLYYLDYNSLRKK